jgi:pre-mRNA-splicing factor SYF1
MYLSIFNHPLCPPLLSHTHARRTYDRALRTLPPSLHARIWTRYLLFAERTQGDTLAHVYRRYLRVDPSLTEHFAALLLDVTAHGAAPRPLEAAKLLLSRTRAAARGEHVNQEGKSALQLLTDFLDVVERFPDDVGMDPDDVDAAATEPEPEPVADGPRPYDEDEDPMSARKLDIEKIVRQDGLKVYTDQAGRLWTGLAAYWTRRGEFDRAKATFEAGIASVMTIRDFTQIFDAYAEFCEELLSAMMKQLDEGGDEEEEEDEEDKAELEEMLDVKMKEFEELMDRRPFLVNDVLLRRNPNDVQEWEKRIALWGQDDVKVIVSFFFLSYAISSLTQVAETYTKAIETIQPKKATANFHRVFISFAKFYEDGGTVGQSQPSIDSARKIFEHGTKVNFKAVEDLAEIWCEWAEMEIRHE